MKAFPRTNAGTDGMDLRDYFAAQIAIGMIANPQTNPSDIQPELFFEAFAAADKMLEAREPHAPSGQFCKACNLIHCNSPKGHEINPESMLCVHCGADMSD